MHEHDPARTSYQSACDLLMNEGLPCPPVPHKFLQKLQQTRYSALFTSNPVFPDPYHFLFYLNQLLTGQCQQMVAFGVSGHGFSSRAMHFYLVDDHIAVLLQDGLPAEPGDWTARQQQDYDLVSQLSIACQDAVQRQQLGVDEKLVICRSFFQAGQWGVVRESGEKIQWHDSNNPLLSGTDWLVGR